MANVNEGLEVGGEGGLDPNNPRDFETILEGKGVPKEADEGQLPSTDIRSGLTTEEPAQAREPGTGRFVAKEATQQTPAKDTSSTVTDTSQVTEDPEVASFLAKYNNDPDAALKAAVHAQSLIGRQGTENAELKERLAFMEGRLEEIGKQTSSRPEPPALTVDQVEEQAQSLIESDGYRDAATKAANVLANGGDERVYRSIMEQWQLESPMDAMDFNTDFRIWQREQRAAAERPVEQAPSWAVRAAEQEKVEGISQSLRAVAAEHDPEDWKVVSEHFDAAMASMPKNVLEMVGSEDSEARDAGVRLVVDRATLLASKAGAAKPAPATPVEEQVPASVARKLAGAAVASSALRPPPVRTDAPQTREDAIAEFKRQIVEVETTNVSSGLTYGPTQ
jgi:hypothetical protein